MCNSGVNINCFEMTIFHLKWGENVLQLMKKLNMSFQICANVSGSCADPIKMLIFLFEI